MIRFRQGDTLLSFQRRYYYLPIGCIKRHLRVYWDEISPPKTLLCVFVARLTKLL